MAAVARYYGNELRRRVSVRRRGCVAHYEVLVSTNRPCPPLGRGAKPPSDIDIDEYGEKLQERQWRSAQATARADRGLGDGGGEGVAPSENCEVATLLAGNID